jgi:mono/diheme cytochrome c family protein
MKKQTNQPDTVQWVLFLVIGLFFIPAAVAILMMQFVTAEMLLVVPPTPVIPTSTPYPETDVLEILPRGNKAAGASLFNELGCASCHLLDGTNYVGPSLIGVSQRIPDEYDSVEAYLISSILRPSEYVVAGYNDVMPPFYAEQLTTQDLADLIAFLMEQ